MAEVAIFLAVKKIGFTLGGEALGLVSSVLKNEASLLMQLPVSLNRIRREFVVMQVFLSHIDTRKEGNKLLEVWLEEVRKLAYGVEDIIDEYVYLIGGQYRSGFYGHLKNIICRPSNAFYYHCIATQLKEIETDLQHVTHMKDRWINMIGEAGSSSNFVGETQLHLADSSHFIKEENIVGIEENKHLLLKWLTNKEQAQTIISVWGMGGVGKTTLVTNVYKSEIKNFECQAWIFVSQTYNTDHLLRRMIKDFFENIEAIPIDIDTMDHRKLIGTLQNFLKHKRYLIILDDVWSPDAFYNIREALDNDRGGIVVISTRDNNVASLATEKCKLELKVLGMEEAWELFCKRAFWKEKDRQCPPHLQSWARQIVSKCGGLPLAIVSIASLLSLRGKTELEWKKVYDQLDWEFSNNPKLDNVKHVLNLSFNYLPRELKNCFLYCSVFPEDYLFQRKRLIRLWIAEGFIEERGKSTREEVGEDYLKELMHRCMVQEVKTKDFRGVRGYRMHDLVRELAISTSKKESFSLVCDDLNAVSFRDETRRLSVHRCSHEIRSRIDLPHLRTFMVFDSTMPTSSLLTSVLSNSKYLSVLDLDGVRVGRIPEEIGNLFNLHYLGLRGTNVKELPESIGRLTNLLTLDLMHSEIEKLPLEITKLRKLQHLLAEKRRDPTYRTYDAISGIRAPNKIWEFKSLQTLKFVEANKGLVGRLGRLTQLTALGVSKVKGSHCAELCASVAKMQCLYFLDISARDKNDTLRLEGLYPPPGQLEKIYLRGRLAEGVESPLFKAQGSSLTQLVLGWSELTKDPLPSISHLSSLSYLWLQNAYNGQHLCFRQGWFPKLKKLILRDMDQLNEVEIEKGAIKSLDYLELAGLKNFKAVPQGIEFLKSLQVLWLRELHPEFQERFQSSGDRERVKHIPTVTYISETEKSVGAGAGPTGTDS